MPLAAIIKLIRFTWQIALKKKNKKLIYLTIQFNLYRQYTPKLYLIVLDLLVYLIKQMLFLFRTVYENPTILIKFKSFKTPKQSPINWLSTINKSTKFTNILQITDRLQRNSW